MVVTANLARIEKEKDPPPVFISNNILINKLIYLISNKLRGKRR